MEEFSKEFCKSEVRRAIEIEPRFLMGTRAYHQLGDISRSEYDLFSATGETDKFWVGAWITGYGFFNVLFPKETSRELTQKEVEKYDLTYVQIGSQPPVKLNISQPNKQ